MQLIQITREQYLALMELGCPAHSGRQRAALYQWKEGKMDQWFNPTPESYRAWAREHDEFWTCAE